MRPSGRFHLSVLRLLWTVGAVSFQFVAGIGAAFLPARMWNNLERRGIPVFPVWSALLTLVISLDVGLPIFFRHLVVSAGVAQRAAGGFRHSDPEAAVVMTQL